MAIDLMQCDAVILAGGKSRRMGTCKALLPWKGKPLICHIAGALAPFDTIWISANDKTIAAVTGLPCVQDFYPDAGPLAGLHAALKAATKEYLLCVPCDLPNFRWELVQELLKIFPDQGQGILCRDSTGRFHPLCGIFHRSILEPLTRQLDRKSFCVMGLMDQISYAVLNTAALFPDSLFDNMNTMSYMGINKKLNDSGVLSPGQYKANRGIVTNNNQKDRVILWNKHMITEILKDITYLGHLAQRKAAQCLYAGISFHRTEEQDWIIVENTHEPIIEQELFDKVQAINNAAAERSKSNSGKYDHLPKAENIYGKKFTCADCGSVMKLVRSFSTKKDKVYFTFKCPTYAEHGTRACNAKKMRKCYMIG